MSARRDLSRSVLRRLYSLLLRAYPGRFRRRFRADMMDDFDRMAERRQRGLCGSLALLLRLLRDWLRSAPREHLRARSFRRSDDGGRLRPPALGGELRQAVRRLRAAPGFSAVVVLVLSLGLGPAIAAYSVANWILFRPIPGVSEPDDLGLVWHGRESEPSWITYPNLEEIAERTETLAGIAGMQRGPEALVLENGAVDELRGRYVTASYFHVLGLRPAAGRFFRDEEDVRSADRIALISHRLARTLFGSPEEAVDETLRLTERPTRVIGVMPEGFHGLARFEESDIWMPGSFQRVRGEPPDFRNDRARGGFYELVARLRPGATWAQAEAELGGLSAWLAETWPEANEGLTTSEFMVFPGVGLGVFGREELRQMLLLIGAISGAVLVIACANAAGLLLTHGLARRSEVAVHKALGASTGRLVRLRLLEALVLGSGGAALGVGLAVGLLRMFEETRFQGLGAPLGTVEIDWRVGLFAVAVSLGAALLAGSLPTLDSVRVDPARRLTGTRHGDAGARRWQTVLGVLQIAVTVPLVIGALLFGRSLWELTRVELGYRPAGLHLLSFDDGSADRIQSNVTRAHMLDLESRLASRSEIEGAAFTTTAPFLGGFMRNRIQAAGADIDPVDVTDVPVSGRYFDVAGIPILVGRSFERDEMLAFEGEDFPAVVLNESLAVRLFGETSAAVGKRVEFPTRMREGRTYRVIGVVGDVRHEITESPPPLVYVPVTPMFLSMSERRMLVRSRVGQEELLDAAVLAGGGAEGILRPMRPIRSGEEAVAVQLAERRLLATLMTILGAIGAVLAGVGLSTAAARNVLTQTREIGIRKALGAMEGPVLRLVLRGLVGGVAAGTLLGIGLTILGLRFVESRLYGITTSDGWSWVVGTSLLAALCILAGILPARRAVRIDPAIALRYER